MRTPGCPEYLDLTRRGFLQGSAGLALGALMPAWLPRITLAESDSSDRDVIVSIFLRGGADGLSICVPHGDRAYYTARPTLAVPPPDSKRAKRALDLDGFFGFSAPFTPLLGAFRSKELLIAHAVGTLASPTTRSHFDAQRWLDVGKPADSGLSSGWLGRHLATVPPSRAGATLRGVSLMPSQAESLRDGPASLPVPNPARFSFDGGYLEVEEMAGLLQRSYDRAPEPLRLAAEQTRATMALLSTVNLGSYRPLGGATYPETDVGQALRSAAALIRADVGIEAIAVDSHGWDTHDNQGTLDGYLAQHMDALAKALAAFHADLSTSGRRYVCVVMSEFGRAVAENDNHGTEHGTANAMLVMGPRVKGGRVLTKWPGLGRDHLYEGQDLRPTLDYRAILAEILAKRLLNARTEEVFPNFTPKFVGTVG